MKNEKNDDGWVLHSAETSCDVTGTKVSGNESYSKKRWFKGSPSEVKSLIQMQFDGYNYEITNIHTIEKYRRHDLTATNHGSIKNYEEKILQFDDFGTGSPTMPKANNPSGFYDPSRHYGNETQEKETEKKEDCKEFVLTMFKDLSQRVSNVDTRVWITMGLSAFAVGLALYGLM